MVLKYGDSLIDLDFKDSDLDVPELLFIYLTL